MDVYILRHGKAEEHGPGVADENRKLTKRGRREVAETGGWMAAQELTFDTIATSPLARAHETAKIVADVLEIPDRLVVWDMLAPGGEPDAICHELDNHPDAGAFLLVGHEPLLSSLISRMIAGNESAGIIMTKGGLAKIRNFSIHSHPSGELHWLLTVKQMAGTGQNGKRSGPADHVFLR
ncbi:MAG: phosphohistidine phosphatase SixA [Methanomicrobiales archaeon]|nr:phosphohistidine phosphatase SixA [Methanomicrobiales archaeon]